MNASGWANWLGEEVGRLKASWVDVIALRELLREFLLAKRDANQLMVCVGERGRVGGGPGLRWRREGEWWSQKDLVWAKR